MGFLVAASTRQESPYPGTSTAVNSTGSRQGKDYYPRRQAKTCTKNSPHRTRSYTASAAAEDEASEWSVAADDSIGVDGALGKGINRMSEGESQGNNTMTEASRGSSDMSMAQMFMAMMQEQQRQREEDRRREE